MQTVRISEAVTTGGIKCLVFGPAGAGKTRLAATCDGRVLMISAEAGLLSLRGTEADIEVLDINAVDQLYEAYEIAQNGNYDWVFLDSLSEVAEMILSSEKMQTKDGRRAYGEMGDKTSHLIRAFRDLPCHVLMTCKQERVQDEGGRLLYSPSMPGQKLGQSLPYFFDEVFAYRVEKNAEGETVRVLQTSKDATHEAKDRSGTLDQFVPPNLALIRAKIYGEL
jgi:phage nucleotide-binding protein